MAFDINENLFNRDGSPSERKLQRYQDTILRLFAASPEGKTIDNEGFYGGRCLTFIDFGLNYLGETLPQMSAQSIRTILFQLFPQKLTTPPEDSSYTIRELQLFWQFLQREFHLKNADACLKVLNDKATARRYEKEMSNPRNYGISKSFAMMGLERGFDISTQEGLDAWMKTYNEELESGKGQRIQPNLGNFNFLNSLFGGGTIVESTLETKGGGTSGELKATSNHQRKSESAQKSLAQRKKASRSRRKPHKKH